MNRSKSKRTFLQNAIGKAATMLPRALWRKERFARIRGKHCSEYMKALAKRGAQKANAAKLAKAA